MQQHALIVRTDGKKTQELDELNLRLQRGWHVVQMTPLGGAGTGRADTEPLLCLAALVIIERAQEEHASLMEQVEEEPEEIVEGNGAELPDELRKGRNGGKPDPGPPR